MAMIFCSNKFFLKLKKASVSFDTFCSALLRKTLRTSELKKPARGECAHSARIEPSLFGRRADLWKISACIVILLFSCCFAGDQTNVSVAVLPKDEPVQIDLGVDVGSKQPETKSPETMSESFEIEVTHFSDAGSDSVSNLDLGPTSTTEQKINDSFSKDRRSKFYNEYIAKYYPKAYVICQKLFKMELEGIPEAINDLIYVKTKEPWFYFQDSPKGFKLIYYWEYIIDQCAIIHEFLSRIRVDLKTKKLIIPSQTTSFNFWSSHSNLSNSNVNTLTLADYLKKKHVTVYADFCAFCFDYLVKMFNEGILLKDANKASSYLYEIEYMFEKLQNTPREGDYEKSTNVCKQVYEILRKKTGYDDYMNYYNNSGYHGSEF
jgi:hypothetical protein